jgi:prepilin peptidase CpaA
MKIPLIYGISIFVFLAVAVYFDLKNRKIPNALVIFSFVCSMALCFFIEGRDSLSSAFTSLLLSFALLLPIYLAKIIAAGDFKLFVALSPMLTVNGTLEVFIHSILWAAILGLIWMYRQGVLKNVFLNIKNIFSKTSRPNSAQLHKIPFATAMFAGFISFIVFNYLNINFIFQNSKQGLEK